MRNLIVNLFLIFLLADFANAAMHVGSIQLESGSKVQFVNPGRRTVLHVDGNVIWRSQNLNADLERVAKGFLLVQHGGEP